MAGTRRQDPACPVQIRPRPTHYRNSSTHYTPRARREAKGRRLLQQLSKQFPGSTPAAAAKLAAWVPASREGKAGEICVHFAQFVSLLVGGPSFIINKSYRSPGSGEERRPIHRWERTINHRHGGACSACSAGRVPPCEERVGAVQQGMQGLRD